MKNLKNMLFAAAIGAVAIAIPVTASADELKACEVKNNKITVPVAGCKITGSLTATDGVSFDKDGEDNEGTIQFAKGASLKVNEGKEVDSAKLIAPIPGSDDKDSYEIFMTKTNNTANNTVTYTADVNKTVGNTKYFVKGSSVTIKATDLGKYATITGTDGNYTITNGAVTIDTDTAISYTTGIVGENVPKTVNYKAIEATKESSKVVGYENDNKTLTKMVEEYINKFNSGAEKYASMELKDDVTVGANNKLGFDENSLVGTVKQEAGKDVEVYDNVVAKLPEGFKAYKIVNATAKFGGATIVKLPTNTTLTISVDMDEPEDLNGKAVYVYAIHKQGTDNESIDLVDTKAYFKNGNLYFNTNEFSEFAIAYGTATTNPTDPAQDPKKEETNTGDATKEANPKTSDNVMTSVVSLLVSAFGLTAAGLKLKNN